MKNSYNKINKRRDYICELLASSDNHSLDVSTIAKATDVSSMTIRRDLDILENMGKVERYHGGARLRDTPVNYGKTGNSEIEQIKQTIARVAARYISDGNTVFINSSSTALEATDYINAKNLTIITNNLRINEHDLDSSNKILLTGGEIRYPKEVLVGDQSLELISHINADIALLGFSGISADGGLTTDNILEAQANSRMIENARYVIIVGDYRKFEREASARVKELEHVDLIITDTYCNTNAINKIEKMGIPIIQV